MKTRIIRIGTRGSKLALTQTEMVEKKLKIAYPGIRTERIIINTIADMHSDKPLAEFGGEGVFSKELERALLDGRIDVAVHSAKDMAVNTATGLAISGVLKREDVRDVLVYRKGLDLSLTGTGKKLRIGTGSPRRRCQIEALYPDFICENIRGNVPTRLDKVRNGLYDGVILAVAGLKRLDMLGLDEFEYRYFTEEEMLPAGGQAIIAIETSIVGMAAELIGEISDADSYLELKTEQYVIRCLNAGCHEPIAVRALVEGDKLTVRIVRAFEGGLIKVSRIGHRAKWKGTADEAVGELING